MVRTWTMTKCVLSFWRLDPDGNNFSPLLCILLKYLIHQMVDSTELCVCLNGASLNIDSQRIISPQKNMTHPIIMTPKVGIRLIMDITIELSCILFTVLLVSTELEHKRIVLSFTLVYWSYIVMKK